MNNSQYIYTDKQRKAHENAIKLRNEVVNTKQVKVRRGIEDILDARKLGAELDYL